LGNQIIKNGEVLYMKRNNRKIMRNEVLYIGWLAPPYGVFKSKWNATLDQTKKLMGVVVIVKHYEKNVMATIYVFFQEPGSSLIQLWRKLMWHERL
jgi:hypothetical protein